MFVEANVEGVRKVIYRLKNGRTPVVDVLQEKLRHGDAVAE